MGYGVALKRPAAVDFYHCQAKQAVTVGAWIATPGWLRDQIERLESEYKIMGLEIMKQVNEQCLPEPEDGFTPTCSKLISFRDEVWLPLAARFYEFAGKHTGSYLKLLFTNFWGNVWDSVKDYRMGLISLRDQAEKAGFVFISPRPLPPQSGPWDTIYTLLKWIIGALVGFGAVMLITSLIRAARS